jgi:hypothetical protein
MSIFVGAVIDRYPASLGMQSDIGAVPGCQRQEMPILDMAFRGAGTPYSRPPIGMPFRSKIDHYGYPVAA